ncbi:exportin-T-like isoform X2 [Elaeis guineensis]
MVDFIVLINQLICKFNTSMGCLLEMIFPAIASRLFAILSSDAFPSGSGANTELCVQIFVKLIKDWCSNFSGEDKVPGFRRFIIEKFATECCLYSVLDKSFDFRDANTLVLFGEIVLAQKVMYEKFGDDFIIHFLSKGLPAVHCPRDLAEQYYQKLQGHDIKTLKSFCQSLIENLRQHQNGSLVFR